MSYDLAARSSAATLCMLALAMCAPSTLLSAQGAHDHHAAHAAHAPAALTDRTRAQIDSARAVIGRYNTPAKAIAAGYRPVLGDIPLQGVHYVNRQVIAQARFDITKPSMLLFSPVGDTVALVGAAYGYHVPASAPDPDGFDGDADTWHEHPMLALPNQRLTMVHLWLVDPPDGPFAHDNATLPFVARGMSVPDSSWLAGPELRELALALALADAPGDRLLRTARIGGEALRDAVAKERGGINAIATQLTNAQQANNRDSYRERAAAAVAHSEQLIATIKNAPPTAAMREQVGRMVDEFIGKHDTGSGTP